MADSCQPRHKNRKRRIWRGTAVLLPCITDYGNAFFDDPAHPAVNLADIVFAPPGWGPPEQIPNPPEAYSKTPIKIHSNIYNVGQIMLSLMEGREMLTPEHCTERIVHPIEYNKVYSFLLEKTVGECLRLSARRRPTLDNLLFRSFEGLAQWQEVYGPVSGDIVPDYAQCDFQDEEFRIGGPERAHMPKKRSAEDENEGGSYDGNDDDEGGNEGGSDDVNENLNDVRGGVEVTEDEDVTEGVDITEGVEVTEGVDGTEEEDVTEDDELDYVLESDDEDVDKDDPKDLDYVFEESSSEDEWYFKRNKKGKRKR
ncbi:hypothetical protein Ptr902_02464 [Pyrenophora tritici-repentis]|nr:hypothetical protein Ptr902_02464 [Pyrenophora tritici-repentis]